MSITNDQLSSLAGSDADVVDIDGDKIGGVGQLYVDDTTGNPSWVTAKTGLFGTSASFVPLQGAEMAGSDIRVAYAKDVVKDAPRIDDDGKLSPDQEEQLYSYYGLADGSGVETGVSERTADDNVDYTSRGTSAEYASRGTTADADYATSGTRAGADRVEDETVGRDTSGPTTDDAMTRSEERLTVGTATQERGRARLRKYVVTENVTQTVPVQREEVRVERESITDANLADAESGPAISEEEHEVVLHEERPVVEKEAVPVERVRLATDTVTEEATVSEDVRKEKIDTEVPDRTDR